MDREPHSAAASKTGARSSSTIRDWNGIDFLEVSDDQLSLCVHFFGAHAGEHHGRERPHRGRPADPRHPRRESRNRHGARSRTRRLPACHARQVRRFLDLPAVPGRAFGRRNLPRDDRAIASRPPGGRCRVRSALRCLRFTFKVDCPSDLDCKPAPSCPPEVFPAPAINYLAKDYASFRQLILDRLALIMPDWRERHVPDLGITLVELLAYVGDHLSYYQDAVATEAYLDTARQRISVRRHARLVDYRLHEGCNARAWVAVKTASDLRARSRPRTSSSSPASPASRRRSGNVVQRRGSRAGCRSDSLRSVRAAGRINRTAVRVPRRAQRDPLLHLGRQGMLPGERRDARDAAGRGPCAGQIRRRAVAGRPADRSGAERDARPRRSTLQVGDVLIFEEVIGPDDRHRRPTPTRRIAMPCG